MKNSRILVVPCPLPAISSLLWAQREHDDLPWREKKRDRMAAKGRMRDRGEVAANAYVNRLALLQCSGDGSVNLFMCILQVVHHCL
jgi:hypothetical protein